MVETKKTSGAQTVPISSLVRLWFGGAATLFAAGVAAISSLLFIVVFVHRPITLIYAPHDDAMFVDRATNLAGGDWLGPFSQFTLMKGPGYPLFLAVSSWTGLPVSLAHGLFHVFATGVLAWVVTRLTRSRLLGVAIVVLVVWHPVFLTDRIIRDAIYPGQTLLVLACLAYSLFGEQRLGSRIVWGLAAGAMFGWFWLTREEGIWLAPGMGLMLVVAVLKTRRHRQWLARVVPAVSAAVVMALLVQAGFRAGNLMAYGKFTGVDTKQVEFTQALAALQSVRSGARESHVPVPRKVREAIYAASPAFASLKPYFDGPKGTPWQAGCQVYTNSCGDIAGGWFIWALRDAAAINGHYKSPAASAEFFAAITHEVKAACRTRRLTCERAWLPLLPPLGLRELKAVPAKLVSAGISLSLWGRGYDDVRPSRGSKSYLARVSAFVNQPRYQPPAKQLEIFQIEGWYYRRGEDWFTLEAENPKSERVRIDITRLESPDLVTQFGDPKATRQRFKIAPKCSAPCRLILTGSAGGVHRLGLSDLVSESLHHLDDGLLYIATVKKPRAIGVREDFRHRVSKIATTIVTALYAGFMPFLAGAGVLAFLVGLVIAWRRRRGNPALVLAAAAWVLIASRVGVLVLIDITLFPGLSDNYMAPAHYLTAFACVVSLAGLVFALVPATPASKPVP